MLNTLTPSLSSLSSLLQQHPECNLFPIYAELPADLETPVSAFLKVRRANQSFLLESVEGGERIARYSFIGTEPYETITQSNVDPLIRVQQCLSELNPCRVRGLPDLTGGAVGYISYDCIRYFEPVVKAVEKDTLNLPESVFMLCHSLVIFDHVKHMLLVVSHCSFREGERSPERVQEEYSEASRRITSLLHRLRGPLPPSNPSCMKTHVAQTRQPIDPASSSELVSNTGQAGYEDFVKTLKQHIVEGNLIQAVPSHRMSRPISSSAFDVYRQLRVINPSPYMFYFELDDFEIVGASPEMLVRLTPHNRQVYTHPIAGTRRRGESEEEDQSLAEDLLQDEKERAEHVMLVDLGRNDVGKISEPGTVRVQSFMQVEKYSHVMHLVSKVVGTLRHDLTSFDAFRSVFPAGTVSGAPKIRAMQVVSGMEMSRRGVYAGAVGYFGFDGAMDMCIAIRTMVIKGGIAHLQAGGGIVHDSEPTAEYHETIHKMKALATAIDKADAAVLDDSSPGAEGRPSMCSLTESVAAYRTFLHDRCGSFQAPLPAHFGEFGGAFAPEMLMHALHELETLYIAAINDERFHRELRELQIKYVSRPTPLTFARRLTKHCGGARIWLKREDLCHTGAHKINNALGMALLARRSGKTRVVAETGAGQHGVATATACALLGLECVVYMGAEDIQRQALNVFRMKLLGATVRSVRSGAQTLKDAINEAMRDWTSNVQTTFYLLGSAVGPHPLPTIVRDFQRIIGDEARQQILEEQGKLPDAVLACVGGGSNAIGMFTAFIGDESVALIGVEAAGSGIASGRHSATLTAGTVGVLHGSKSIMIQDDNGQVIETHSISAGLDYPGVGPQHAHLQSSGRATYVPVEDKHALQALRDLCRLEGIIPALESAHAVYHSMEVASHMQAEQDIVICLSGRGDKDMERVSAEFGFALENEDRQI